MNNHYQWPILSLQLQCKPMSSNRALMPSIERTVSPLIRLNCHGHLLNCLIVLNAAILFLQLGCIEANFGAHLQTLRDHQESGSFTELIVIEIFTILAVLSSVLSGLLSVLGPGYNCTVKLRFLLCVAASLCSGVSFLQLYRFSGYEKWNFLHVEVHLLGLTGFGSGMAVVTMTWPWDRNINIKVVKLKTQ